MTRALGLQTLQKDVREFVDQRSLDDYFPNSYTVITLSLVAWGLAQFFVPWEMLALLVALAPSFGMLIKIYLQTTSCSRLCNASVLLFGVSAGLFRGGQGRWHHALSPCIGRLKVMS